jgi:hypothetical protein
MIKGYDSGYARGLSTLFFWTKFGSIILEQRKRLNDPGWFKYFKYFADEMEKHSVRLGIEPEITDADGYTTR